MNDDGYTLIEMLAALLMLGLAMAGLAEAVRAIGRAHARTAVIIKDERALAAARRGLVHLFEGSSAFRSDDRPGLVGNERAFTFLCGRARCGAQLTHANAGDVLRFQAPAGRSETVLLREMSAARFMYAYDQGATDHWPPLEPTRQTLTAISIEARGRSAAPIAVASAPLWIEQPAGCSYGAAIEDCRGGVQ